MQINRFLMLTACLALAACACLATLPAPPLIALGVALLVFFASTHIRQANTHPRSIFETRQPAAQQKLSSAPRR